MEERKTRTAFQEACLEAVGELLLSRNIPHQFEEVRGEEEVYWKMRLALPSNQLEVYIYEDEAGVFVNGEWHPYESVDFDTPQQLIERFTSDLGKWLE